MSNKPVAKLDNSLLASKGAANAEGFRPPDWVVSTSGASAWPTKPEKSADGGLPEITLILPPEEHQRLVLMAAKLGISAKKLIGAAVNSYLVYLDNAEVVLQEVLHGEPEPAAALDAPLDAKPKQKEAKKPLLATKPAAKGGKAKKK